MLKLIKGNPYNLDLLVGALKYIISNCESFNNKAMPEEGYYDEWGYYHYPTEVTDDGTENRDDILSKFALLKVEPQNQKIMHCSKLHSV